MALLSGVDSLSESSSFNAYPTYTWHKAKASITMLDVITVATLMVDHGN